MIKSVVKGKEWGSIRKEIPRKAPLSTGWLETPVERGEVT